MDFYGARVALVRCYCAASLIVRVKPVSRVAVAVTFPKREIWIISFRHTPNEAINLCQKFSALQSIRQISATLRMPFGSRSTALISDFWSAVEQLPPQCQANFLSHKFMNFFNVKFFVTFSWLSLYLFRFVQNGKRKSRFMRITLITLFRFFFVFVL